MATFIATYPPVGQVTQLQDAKVAFHAILDVPQELAAEPWQLVLWHSDSQGGEWTEAQFQPGSPDVRPSELHAASDTKARLYFSADLAVKSQLNFTVKFRQGPDHDWRWLRNELGVDDGLVVVDQKATLEGEPDLPDLIPDLNPDLKWKSHLSQSPDTRLWSIEAGVDAATDEKSAYADVPLGVPWGGFLKWFALVQPWAPWWAPRHGNSSLELDKDAVLCSFLSPQGKHLVFLGMSGLDDVITLFRSGDVGRLMFHIRSDNAKAATGTALVAVSDNVESAVAAVMYHARNLVTVGNAPAVGEVAEPAAEGDVGPQWYENWYDGLGYCTWNSLGQHLTEEKVLKAVDTLAENNISISSLILDDNWQDIDYRGDGQWQYGWNDFEAEPKTFPGGLKKLIYNIRSKHKNIQHIAVWHALLGYWAGLAPNGPLAKRYKTIEVERAGGGHDEIPIDGMMTLVAKEETHKFYDDFYRFLASCNIDGVKTDGQYMVDTWVAPSARRDLINTYLDAWHLSSLRHFRGKVISCMSLSPPILFHSQLPTHRPPFVCRNSDDYWPPNPSSQPWHVFANAHTALLTQHLNILPDWDMFQTHHEYGAFHAAARCVSGGPVYITDVPGQHDLNLIRQMTGVTPQGKTVVFRPSTLGRALDTYVGYQHPAALLKVGAYHGRALPNGTPIVAVFNVLEQEVTEVVALEKFPGVAAAAKGSDAGVRYVVRSHVTGKVTPPVRVGEPGSLVSVTLGVRGYDVLCAYPLTAAASRTRAEVWVANLGLVGKLTGCAAVVGTKYKVLENGRMLVDATLKALGVLGVYISALPELSIGDDFMVTIQGQPIPPHTVSVNKQDKHVLDVDVETAWKEMGLKSGWANEVEVKVYFALEKI